MAKKHKLVDPFAEREAAKYPSPIPSREFILQFLQERGSPAEFEEIAAALQVRNEETQEALRRRLVAMERDGQLIRNRRKGYGPLQNMGLIRGRVSGHREGYGFLIPDDGSNDLFLPEHQMRTVFDGDHVIARLAGVDRRGRYEGAIVEVLERATQQFVGRLIHEGGAYFVLPDNTRIRQQILIPPEHMHGACEGLIVVAELIGQPTKYSLPIGKIVEVLGEHMAPGMEIDIATRSYNLPSTWSVEVEAEIKTVKPQVSAQDKEGRLDLRHLPLVTIDGEDARDFDDAVFCEPTRQGWRLLVAIADVAHYVKPGTALDMAAEERGNSVYFPERVIPMLPEILSNDLCSLNPQVDRLCMVCEITLNRDAEVTSYRFHEAVMRSHARLTYTDVGAMLQQQDSRIRDKYALLVPHLENLHALYQALRITRDKRGAIDFEIPETKILFGTDRKIERIVATVRNDAHRLIEECMLLANVCTAQFLVQHQIPVLYRNHLGPTVDKLMDLKKFLAELGLKLGGGEKPRPKNYAKVLSQAANRPDALLIQTVMLRSLSQAVYQAENLGHFGLAYEAYTHFTSPIRRYPDLLVHRAIKHILADKQAKQFVYNQDKMMRLGSHCSVTERRADDAVREAVSWLKCEFMQSKIGQIFDGIISGVTSFGVFVTLSEVFVDGLVHITALKNDYYRFDPTHHRLTGERGGSIYRIGDRLRVKVVRVDLDERKMDFDLVQTDTESAGKKKNATAKGKPNKKVDPKKTASTKPVKKTRVNTKSKSTSKHKKK